MKSQGRNRLRVIALRAIALFIIVAVASHVVVELASRSQISDRLDTISQSAYRLLNLQHEIVHGELDSIACWTDAL